MGLVSVWCQFETRWPKSAVSARLPRGSGRFPARSRSDKWSREDLRYVFELLRDVEQRTRVLRQHIQRSHSEGRFQQKRRIAVEALVGGELTPDSLVELTASPGIKQRNARVHR